MFIDQVAWERVDLGERAVLSDIVIKLPNGVEEKFDVQLCNCGKSGTFEIVFWGKGYKLFTIKIVDGKVKFARRCFRPKHEHDNQDVLCVALSDSDFGGRKRGDVFWQDSPGAEETFFGVDFGSVEVGW